MPMMSRKEFAAILGVTRQAVDYAVKRGRLKGAVRDGKIDSSLGARLWEQNTDQSKPRNSISGDPHHRKADPNGPSVPVHGVRKRGRPRKPRPEGGDTVAVPPPKTQLPDRPAEAADTPEPPEGSGAYITARTNREHYLSLLAKIDYEAKSGRLVDAEEARAASFSRARKARDMLMGIPSRVSAVLAAETDAFQVERILIDEIYRVCNELADAGTPAGADPSDG